MLPKLFTVSLLGALFSSSHVNAASSLGAKWIYPSDTWYFAEGNWSAFPIIVGTSGRAVDVLVSTTLAETWVVQPGACPSRETDQDGFLDCKRLRGGLFNRSTSESWVPLGAWGLGLEYLGIREDGDYGNDTLSMESIGTSIPFHKTAIAALNGTDPYIGLIGLGAKPGRFDQNVAYGAIDSVTVISPEIPSRSYGYTAGAYYALNGTGSPSSLTFGGYDANRFRPHSEIFYMQDGIPVVNVRGIQAWKPSVDSVPTHWNSTSEVLVRVNDSITAIIDTTTPYIWLPSAICDRFAAAFNLTWDEKSSFYRLGNTTEENNAQYNNFYLNTDLNFTFSLSDVSNNDTFGDPLNQDGVVNITVPMAAFIQPMDFPFADIKFGESRIPFFPLRRALNDSILILGRSFMQEAYIVTKYDPDPQFSIHQVLFPNDPTNVSIQTIDGPFDKAEVEKEGLSTSQMAGIVFAACAIATIIVIIIVCRRRRKKARQAGESGQTEEVKDGVSDMEPDVPKTPMGRLFSLITRWKRQNKQQRCEVEGNQCRPAEIAADKDHQRYELPAPTEPVELDGNDRLSVNGTTEFGTEDTRNMTAYEIAQRKIERQLQGPVPAYTPPEDGASMPSDMKSGQDMCIIEHYRPPYNPSTVSSPTAGNHSNSAPSPLSPYSDWPNRVLDLPSPMTIAPYPSPHFPNTTSNLSSGSPPVSPNPSSMSRSNSSRSPPRSPHDLHNPTPPSLPSLTEGQRHLTEQNNDPSPTSWTASHSAGSLNSTHFSHSPTDASAIEPPTAAIQRTPIDPSHIVCLGPLPDNVQLPQPHHQPSLASIPRLVGPDGRSIVLPVMQHPKANISVDTLGSNFTEEEEFEGIGQQQVAPPTVPPIAAATREARMRQGPPPAINTRISQLRLNARQEEEDLPRSPMRIDSGLDIVHVPQLAERRYSWEDDRT